MPSPSWWMPVADALHRVRQLAPEESAERRLASGRRVRLVRRTDETLTIVRRLTRSDEQGFAALLGELETL